MRKNSPSQSGFLNPRLLLAFALCSVGVFLAMFSFAATPPGAAPRIITSVASNPASSLRTVDNNVNRLPPGVPFPPSGLDAPLGRKPGIQSPLNREANLSNSSPSAGLPGVAGRPLRPGTASRANSLGNQMLANQQPAPLSVQQPAASERMPLASADPSGWSIVGSPNTSTTQGNVPTGVTCASASECWAVGYYTTGTFAYQTLIERWDGTSWSIVSSPDTSAAQYNVLSGVTCVSASECWAVGSYYTDSFVRQTLIERWDGN
jgi:hypothetical protein